MLKKFSIYYSPDDAIVPAPGDNLPKGKEDTITFLGMDDKDEKEEVIPLDDKKSKEKPDEKVIEKDEEEPVEEDEKEVDELKEIEESLEEDEVTEEQLELVTPVSRKEILKKYPTLFKDFPHLETAFYRNYQFTELFPTIPEAKEALAKSETLDAFDQDLSSGNTKNVLLAVKDNPKAFNKIVDNYMSTLAEVDKDAYFHVTGNTIKQTIIAMVKESHKSDNDVLRNAAAILNQFVFGSSEFEPPKNLSSEKDNVDPGKNELETAKQKFTLQKLESANTELSRIVQNSLKATIAANLDPKNSMSDFVKKHASKEVLDDVERIITSDKQFNILLDKMWDRAVQADFSKESTDRIRNAFFAKAKMLLPAAIKKARIEALKGMGKRSPVVDKDVEEDDKVDRPEKRERSSNNGKVKAGEVPKGMSTLDFLMKD